MDTNERLQQALNKLAEATAVLSDSAIRLRCVFSDESRKREQKACVASFGANSLDMQFAASSAIDNSNQSAQVARADLGNELDPLRIVSSEEVDTFCAMFPSKTFFSHSDARIALNIFITNRRRAP